VVTVLPSRHGRRGIYWRWIPPGPPAVGFRRGDSSRGRWALSTRSLSFKLLHILGSAFRLVFAGTSCAQASLVFPGAWSSARATAFIVLVLTLCVWPMDLRFKGVGSPLTRVYRLWPLRCRLVCVVLLSRRGYTEAVLARDHFFSGSCARICSAGAVTPRLPSEGYN
jgi:hypothetical protein